MIFGQPMFCIKKNGRQVNGNRGLPVKDHKGKVIGQNRFIGHYNMVKPSCNEKALSEKNNNKIQAIDTVFLIASTYKNKKIIKKKNQQRGGKGNIPYDFLMVIF